MKRGFSALPVEEWPERDRTLWAASRQDGGYWDDDGLAAHWRPATIVTAECHYGTFLWWLKKEGRLHPTSTPVERATQDNIKDFIEDYSANHAASSVGAVIRVVADMVRVTAPATDVRWVYGLARRIKRQAIPVKPPNHRMHPAIELVSVANALMERGEQLLEERPLRAAIHFRDGLMILAETSLPLRRKNYAGLRLGHTLYRGETGYRVSLPAGEMKNHRDWEGWYPDWLTERFDLYIEQVRPVLRGGLKKPDEGWLWLGRRGLPLKGVCISTRIREIMQTTIGVPLSLHGFRHSVTTDIAIHDPQHVGIVKSLLGHSSPTSSRYYDLASNMEASVSFQRLMSSLIQDDLGK